MAPELQAENRGWLILNVELPGMRGLELQDELDRVGHLLRIISICELS